MPYHHTSLETPPPLPAPHLRRAHDRLRSVADVGGRGRGEANLTAGEELGSIGSADYHGWLYAASEARDMLPLGLASGARITRNVSRGQAIPRSGVELARDSFVVGLRRLQETSLDRDP